MSRFAKSLVSAGVLEGIAWAIGNHGAPVGLHVQIFTWMHFAMIPLVFVSRAFASLPVMVVMQFLFWTLFFYVLYGFIGGQKGRLRGTKADS